MNPAKLLVCVGMSALTIFLTSPLFAEQTPWNGLMVEENEIPEEETPIDISILEQADIAPPAAYGTTNYTSYTLGACDGFVRDNTHTSSAPNCNYITSAEAVGQTQIGFPFHLPNGAILDFVDISYYDNDASNPSIGLYQISKGVLDSIFNIDPSAWSSGDRYVRFGPISHTVTNADNSYTILAIIPNGNPGNVRLYSFVIWYKLQISPSPSVATFSDVPTSHPFFQHIEALVGSGITTGYQDGTYRPDNYVTRAQMAAFLARALGLNWPY